MTWWVVTDEMYPMGPYNTSMKAQSVRDGLDCPAEVYQTESSNKSEAYQELRHQLIERKGSHMAHKNFKSKKVPA